MKLDNSKLDFSQFCANTKEQEQLLELVNTIMPFGKYKGIPLLKLPEPYIVWFKGKGFPKGKLGQQLNLLYEIKLNGLEQLLLPLLQDTHFDDSLHKKS